MNDRMVIENILGLFAIDNDLYREIFVRLFSSFSLIFGFSKTTVESFLRGSTYRKLSNGKKIYIGRYVVFAGRDKIRLGEDVRLYGFDYLNAEGNQGYIHVGEKSHIDQFCVLYGQGGLEIGNYCAIASGVKIYSQSNQYSYDPDQKIIEQPVVYRKVKIGDDVWVGANAVILPGVEIGVSAIVGAGAVVRKEIPSCAIVAGVPAEIIGWRKTGKLESVR